MFALALLIGIYSYLIFALGLIGQLSFIPVLVTSIVYLFFSIIYLKKELLNLKNEVNSKSKINIFSLLIFGMMLINLIGALGPETSFDSLWYHLTIPKIFLQNHGIYFIPGSLFYYSVMPKLVDLLYIPALLFGNEIVANLIHFSLGILCLIALYKLSKEFFDKKLSLLTVLIFASNLVFAWESTTAYIDLGRTFFEIMALWGVVISRKNKDQKILMESGIMLGLAITSKIIAAGSLFILLPIIYLSKKSFKNILIFSVSAIMVPIPWLVYAYIQTGNPFYPIFSGYDSSISMSILNPIHFIKDLLTLFLHSDDPISPIYFIFVPLVFLYFNKLNKDLKIILYYSIISILVWYLTPRTGGGRFILPYLPAFSILTVGIYNNISNKILEKFFLFVFVFIAVLTMGYRGIANFRYVPFILGLESKDEYLVKNLNFSYGDFYDKDNYFKDNLKTSDRVLLFGFHNLYYADFNYIEASSAKKGDEFNYIATQNMTLPERFSFWSLVYSNQLTHVNLYKFGDAKWHY